MGICVRLRPFIETNEKKLCVCVCNSLQIKGCLHVSDYFEMMPSYSFIVPHPSSSIYMNYSE